MKSATRIITLSAVAIFQLAPAHAERYAFDWERPGYQEPSSQPSKSRAQVIEELAKARSNGEVSHSDHDYPHFAPEASTRTREEVKQEAIHSMHQLDSSLYGRH